MKRDAGSVKPHPFNPLRRSAILLLLKPKAPLYQSGTGGLAGKWDGNQKRFSASVKRFVGNKQPLTENCSL